MIRVALPYHLRNLARVGMEVELALEGPATLGAVLDELETRHPVLRGAIRDHGGGKRRPFLRFFVCGEDWSHQPYSVRLPDDIEAGREPLLVIGAIAGGSL